MNTSTDVRPAPPPASAIVVAPKLTVVWKNPVTAIAVQVACGVSGARIAAIAAKSTAIATQVRCTFSTTGSAAASASFIASQFIPHTAVSAPSAT